MKISIIQEYISRNKIKVPVVCFKKKSCVILKNKKDESYRILSITWRNQDYHPGFYDINYYEPIKNVLNTKLFNTLFSDIWHYEGYEDNLLDFCKTIKQENFYCGSYSQQIFDAWKIFLDLAGIDLCKTYNFDFQKQFFILQSIRSSKEKKHHFDSLQILLRSKKTSYSDLWFYRIKSVFLNVNSKWLADLLKN
jgi:hypothetical protein